MKKILIIIMLLIVLGSSQVPLLVSAQVKLDYSGFVDCDGVVGRQFDDKGNDIGPKPGEKDRQQVCNFAALIRTFTKLINWMFIITIPLATVLFAYGGILYIRGTEGSRKSANKIFTSIGIGFIIMLVAWFAVQQVVTWFVKTESGATTFLGK